MAPNTGADLKFSPDKGGIWIQIDFQSSLNSFKLSLGYFTSCTHKAKIKLYAWTEILQSIFCHRVEFRD